jgi:hypothetical protein
VDAAEEHHMTEPAQLPVTHAEVTHITAVHCRFAPQPDKDPRTLYPVPGSAIFTSATSADGWTPAQGDHRFVGYLVEIDTT